MKTPKNSINLVLLLELEAGYRRSIVKVAGHCISMAYLVIIIVWYVCACWKSKLFAGPLMQSTEPPQTDAQVGIGMKLRIFDPKIIFSRRKGHQLAEGNSN